MTPVTRKVRVKVPATSANLGSGFDTVGLALDYHDELEFTLSADPVNTAAQVMIEGEGEDTLPRDETHLVVSTFRRACQTFGLGRVGFILQAHNNIPQARGMGSSAEAIVAGIAAAAAFAQDDDLNRDAVFELDYKEALYLGRGERDITFESKDAARPAKFYFNSTTAHCTYPDRKVTKADADCMELGSLEGSNHRIINRMLVSQVLPTCQLQMGMTELQPGSVWNTMPAHVHSRRMEAYFYFELPEDQAVCHLMGEVSETRHVWMQGEQAVLSPEWSIHSAAATHNYTFIWGMGGENLDYGDQDFSAITDLR